MSKQRDADSRAEIARMKTEVAMSRVIAAREFRRWRRAIRVHLNGKYADHEAEANATIELARQLTWTGDVRDLKLLGTFGESLVDVISVTDAMLDDIEGPLTQTIIDHRPLDELVVSVRARLKNLEKLITGFLDKLDQFSREP